jgi:hypothetical protein
MDEHIDLRISNLFACSADGASPIKDGEFPSARLHVVPQDVVRQAQHNDSSRSTLPSTTSSTSNATSSPAER